MSRRLFVSRHPGAWAWAQRRWPDIACVEHLDPEEVRPGDTVMGTLPVPIAAEVCGRGATYLHLTFGLAAGRRGEELSADQLEELGATLRAFSVRALEGRGTEDEADRRETG